jgi:hypothetical protein
VAAELLPLATEFLNDCRKALIHVCPQLFEAAIHILALFCEAAITLFPGSS